MYNVGPTPSTLVQHCTNAVADPESARGGGVSHILAEKRGVSFTLFKKMHENLIFSPITGGGGGTPGTPYAGSATANVIQILYKRFVFIGLM